MITTKFDMVLKADTGETYMDWNWFAVFRSLFHKLSSYTVASINLPLLYIIGLNDRISKNDFPIITITCYYIDETNKRQRMKTIFIKKYYILKCINTIPVTENEERIPCTLILGNPIFREMYSNNGFNKILYGITALNAISEFENFIKDTYGDIFDFIKIGNNLQINSHVYEQIMFKNLTDLAVPAHIIQKYKPFHTFNVYFFDDFNLNIDKEIACYHLNFANCKQTFTQYDVTQMPDIVTQCRIYQEFTIEDQFENINKNLDKASLTIIDRYMNSINIKKQQYEALNMKITNKQEEELFKKRKIKILTTEPLIQKKTIYQSIQNTNIYAPDTIDNGKIRFDVNKKLYTDGFRSFRLIRTNYDLPDWLTFDKIYNIDLQDMTNYAFIPISAVNIFRRISSKEQYLTHGMEAMFLQVEDVSL